MADELRHPPHPQKYKPGSATDLIGSLKADLILIDDSKGAAAALTKGFEITGTLGVLDLAARRRLINLRDALDRLKRTNFRYRQEILDVLLDEPGDQLKARPGPKYQRTAVHLIHGQPLFLEL